MKIHVTAEHIKNGRRCDGDLCAVALALDEATGHDWSVKGSKAFNLTTQRVFYFDRQVIRFIAAFDFGQPVCPFEFDLS